jgi:hypothetical protein
VVCERRLDESQEELQRLKDSHEKSKRMIDASRAVKPAAKKPQSQETEQNSKPSGGQGKPSKGKSNKQPKKNSKNGVAPANSPSWAPGFLGQEVLEDSTQSRSRNYCRRKAHRAARRREERRLDRAGVTVVPESLGQVARARTRIFSTAGILIRLLLQTSVYKLENSVTNMAFHDYSSHTFTADELFVLGQGLNFVPTPRAIEIRIFFPLGPRPDETSSSSPVNVFVDIIAVGI